MLFGFEDPENLAVPETAESTAPETPAEPNGTRRPWRYALGGLVVGALICGLAWALWPDPQPPLTAEDIEATIADELDARSSAPTAAAQAYEQIAPSLVVVRALSADDDAAAGIGAGVVINDRGEILTSLHVVAEADSIELRFADGATSAAEVQSADATLDIAVLSATNRTAVLVPAVMGNPRTLQVGDTIFAVGNPLGLTASITAGVISGLNRDIPFPDDEPDNDDTSELDQTLEDLIQFDAAVNQGSSGGPLLNADGQVVGIVTALADPGGQGFFVGIGFAVPIDLAATGAADGPSQ